MNKLLLTFAITCLLVAPAFGTAGDCAQGGAAMPINGCQTCDGTTATDCTVCLPGFNLDTKRCQPCAAGTTANAAGSAGTETTCAATPAGYWSILSDNATHGKLAAGNPTTVCADGKGVAAGGKTAAECTITCTGDGINVCTGVATEAVTCKSGFYKDALTCQPCTIANCGVCTSDANACTTCKDGFFKSGDGTAGVKHVCTACTLDGCVGCAADKAQCTKAKKGYKLVSETSVLKCEDGGFTNAADNSETSCKDPCPAKCLSCMDDKTKCTKCEPNWAVKAADSTCEDITTTKHGTCLTANGITEASCITCTDGLNREREPAPAAPAVAPANSKCICKAGFRDQSADTTPAPAAADKWKCVPCSGTGVKSCTANVDIPTACVNADHLFAGQNCAAAPVAPSTAGPEGFWYDGTATPKQFVPCDPLCKTCTGAGNTKCVDCAVLVLPSSFVAPSETAANYKTYLTAMFKNGTSCFKECPTGFVANTAKTACEAGDATGGNSVLLSAIALIFSLFLIF